MRRPLARHRLLLELDVVCVDDLPARELGALLRVCAAAGLMGLSVAWRRVELDGRPVADELAPARRDLVPPADDRVAAVAHELVRDVRVLAALLGLSTSVLERHAVELGDVDQVRHADAVAGGVDELVDVVDGDAVVEGVEDEVDEQRSDELKPSGVVGHVLDRRTG